MARKISAIVVALIVLGGASFYLWNNVNIGFNKEPLLLKRFNEFSSLISVNLCQEAYDGFVTDGSKERKGDNFFAHCHYRNEDWSDFKISAVVFSGNKRADIRYDYKLERPDLDSKEWEDCFHADFSIETCDRVAPKEIVGRTSTETWLYEQGEWKRDY